MCTPNFIKIGPVVFEKFNIFVNFHWLFAASTEHRAPEHQSTEHQGRNQLSYRVPCLISPALLIVENSNIVFKCFEGLRTRISDFRSDSPDRETTLQRSQNVKSGLFMRVWCSNWIFKGYVVCRWRFLIWKYTFDYFSEAGQLPKILNKLISSVLWVLESSNFQYGF